MDLAPRSSPDGLPEPRRDMRSGPNIYRRQPPVVGDVCRGVSSKNATAPCAHQSQLCQGPPAWCPRCRFPFCQYHYPRHIYVLVAPQDVWANFTRRLTRWKDKVAKDPKAKPRVVPEFPLGDPDG